jgi:RNA polymerase sigma factor (sigma-70 family)
VDGLCVADPTPPELSADVIARLRHGVRLMALHELGDRDAADEVAQETLARVVIAVREHRVRDLDRLGAFARGVARHVMVDTLRARQREVPMDGAAVPTAAVVTESALDAMVTAEQLQRVRAALGALSDSDREILRLTFFENATSEEVAKHMQEPAARIRKRKERALERLRRAFDAGIGHTSQRRTTELRIAAVRAAVPELRTE